MVDVLCMMMGVVCIIAGALILFGFGHHTIGMVFGILIILKGGFSFI